MMTQLQDNYKYTNDKKERLKTTFIIIKFHFYFFIFFLFNIFSIIVTLYRNTLYLHK
jgi:hypothetical protein